MSSENYEFNSQKAHLLENQQPYHLETTNRHQDAPRNIQVQEIVEVRSPPRPHPRRTHPLKRMENFENPSSDDNSTKLLSYIPKPASRQKSKTKIQKSNDTEIVVVDVHQQDPHDDSSSNQQAIEIEDLTEQHHYDTLSETTSPIIQPISSLKQIPTTSHHDETDLKKHPRKRWSTDANVLCLPNRLTDSLAQSSRSSSSSSRHVGIRNRAFDFDEKEESEDVVTIETDPQSKSTKIQLKRTSIKKPIPQSHSQHETDEKSKESNSETSNRKQELSSKKKSKDIKKIKKTRKKIKEKVEKKEMKYVSIMIHRADALEPDLITRHPMVKVYIVESSTGNYFKYPRDAEKSDRVAAYLQPMVTATFDFQENHSMIPQWNQELIFGYDFQELFGNHDDGHHRSEDTLVLFEIVDLLTFAEASFSYDHFGSEGCWYKIAWAFFRPISSNETSRIDQKVRLQLYRPGKSTKRYTRHKCEIWTWWKSSIREKYHGSLFVTISSVKPPKLEEPIFYGLDTHAEILSNDDQHERYESREMIPLPRCWNRLAAQSCKVPNSLLFQTENSENGYFYVAFSNDGKYLACTRLEDDNSYPIIVYRVDEPGTIYSKFLTHSSFVYSLDWSSNNEYVLSTSSDQTARLWDVANKIVQHVQVLPHPSYVYCAKFHSDNFTIIATGCHDHVVRIWTSKSHNSHQRHHDSPEYVLQQELESHEGSVSSICFEKKGSGLLSADTLGVVIQWSVVIRRRPKVGKDDDPDDYYQWNMIKKIKSREIDGVAINTILLHPYGSRLLVHSRDNSMRMLDIASGVILQTYRGFKNSRIQIKACISPCGGLVLCGGEDSTLTVWCLESGKRLAKYNHESSGNVGNHAGAITSVDYHPYDHVLAYSVLGTCGTVRVLRFVKDASQQISDTVNLQLIEKNDCSSIIRSSIEYPSREEAENTFKKSGRRIKNQHSRLSLDNHVSNAAADSLDDTLHRQTRSQDLKLTFGMLNKCEANLKQKGTNKLTNIIEKIDKILSNTTTRTVGRNFQKNQSSNSENSSSSAGGINKYSQRGASRLKVREEGKVNEEIMLDTLTMNSPDRLIADGSPASLSGSGVDVGHRIDHDGTPSSSGTYVLKKSAFDLRTNDGDIVSESSSLQSNGTFIVEQKKTVSSPPIPKPRKRRSKQDQKTQAELELDE